MQVLGREIGAAEFAPLLGGARAHEPAERGERGPATGIRILVHRWKPEIRNKS
jgi:hypothetical protein